MSGPSLNQEQRELIQQWIDHVKASGSSGIPLESDVREFLMQQGYDADVINKTLSLSKASKTTAPDPENDTEEDEKPEAGVVRGSDEYFGVERLAPTASTREEMTDEQNIMFAKIIRVIKDMRGKDRRYFVRELGRYTDK